MDVRSVYEALEVDFSEVLVLLRKEDRVAMYLELTMSDPAFATLDDAMAHSDWDTAFRAAHTIKGMAMNLVLKPLSDAAIDLVECLRGGLPDEGEARQLYARLHACAADVERLMADESSCAPSSDQGGDASEAIA